MSAEDEKKEEDRGRDIPTKCKTCGVENEDDAKFCKGCGESMATEAPEEPEEPPPSSKSGEERKAEGRKEDERAHPPPPERMVAPAKMSPEASLASILGASGESPLALKTAAIGLRHIKDTAVGVTGQQEPGAIVGTLLTFPDRLARADEAVRNEKDRAAKTEKAMRWDLAKRLNKLALDAWPRTMIFRDEEHGGKRVAVGLRPTVAAWDLDEFRGYVEGFERQARPRDPYEASRERAEAGARDRAATERVDGRGGVPKLDDNGKPSKADIARAKTDPAVLRMFQRPENTRTLDAIAEGYIITAAQQGVALGGAA